MSVISSDAITYGFIGLGVMGWGMAKNLRAKLPASAKLVICELQESRRDQFVKEAPGVVEVAMSPREVAERSNIIITMLPKGPHVLDAFTNESTGLLSAKIPSDSKRLFIDCSTIDVKTSLEVGKAVSNTGSRFIDSPVSGGPNGANAGTLTFMVGGSSETFDEIKLLLELMGKSESIFYCGPPGAGLATKQINNYLSAISILGVSEAMNMGVRYGLDPKILAGVINVSSGKCYNSLEQNPVKGITPTAAAAKDFEGGFSMELCKGVVDMAVELGRDVGAKSVLAGVVQETYEKAVRSERCKGKDCRSVYRLFAEDDGRGLD